MKEFVLVLLDFVLLELKLYDELFQESVGRKELLLFSLERCNKLLFLVIYLLNLS